MSQPSDRSLGDYVQFARRNIVLISVFVLLGLAGGDYVQMQSNKSFTSTASILLAPVPTYVSLAASGPPPSEITIDTDARLLRYEQTLDRVAAATGEDRASVAKRLNVTAPTSTRVLKVSYTAPDRNAATVGISPAAQTFAASNRVPPLRDRTEPAELRLSDLIVSPPATSGADVPAATVPRLR